MTIFGVLVSLDEHPLCDPAIPFFRAMTVFSALLQEKPGDQCSATTTYNENFHIHLFAALKNAYPFSSSLTRTSAEREAPFASACQRLLRSTTVTTRRHAHLRHAALKAVEIPWTWSHPRPAAHPCRPRRDDRSGFAAIFSSFLMIVHGLLAKRGRQRSARHRPPPGHISNSQPSAMVFPIAARTTGFVVAALMSM